jgi:hypothetical protein
MSVEMVAIASLRIDKGEDLSYAFAAIERMVPNNPSDYAFDVIYSNSIEKRRAARYIKIIRNRIIERLPNAKLYTGITDNEMKRPGAEQLLTKMRDEGTLSPFTPVIDLNPGREASWDPDES